VSIARLEPIRRDANAEGRIGRLQRQGIVRPSARRLPDKWLKARPPRLLAGRTASDIVIRDRSEYR